MDVKNKIPQPLEKKRSKSVNVKTNQSEEKIKPNKNV
jgi:hypothetical protein